ncbi:MAG: response regulator [Negativicutes bacterium]|nr:response regulator [Negativicutes bacterium]MBP8629098.1 response regulator [Negativicutes bacterium]MBP9536962.1 response regulator [Negativicutes bacterium]MBP9949125.1 response regulator [Negativicutes bacterium]
MIMKILIADDEESIIEVVKIYLEKEGYSVLTALDGDTALELEIAEKPDLLILDIMLPKMSGLELCRAIEREVPVIFLTAKTSEEDKIAGFALGADDYITKPFSPRELIARVKAVMRRSNLAGTDGIISVDGMSIDLNNKNVKIADALVTLTPKEFELLYFLLKHPKQTFSREKLLTNIWGYDFEGDERTVDATIKRLRQKLLHPHYHYIQTSRGFGYKFEVLKHD